MCQKWAQKEVIVFASPPPPLHSHTNVSWYQQVVQATFVLKHYTSNKKKYLVQGDIHKCKRMSNIVIPIHNHSKDTKKTKYNRLSFHRDSVSYALGT